MSLLGDSKDTSYPRPTIAVSEVHGHWRTSNYLPNRTTRLRKSSFLWSRPRPPAGGCRSYSERLLQLKSSREATQGTTASWKRSAQRSKCGKNGSKKEKKGGGGGKEESSIDRKGDVLDGRCQDPTLGPATSPNLDFTSSPRPPDFDCLPPANPITKHRVVSATPNS